MNFAHSRLQVLVLILVVGGCDCDDGATDPITITDTGEENNISADSGTQNNQTDSGNVGHAGPGPSDDWGSLPPDQVSELETALDQAMTEMGLNGAAMGVAVYNDQAAWSGAAGFDNYADETPWTAGCSVRIGSVSKTFTVASIYLLIEEGVITLDDDLELWVPGYYDGVGVQLRHLITNTSGIVSYNYVGSFDDTRPWQPSELVEWAVTAEPDLRFAPGTEWEYSNTNYVLLGLVIESASGQSYEDFITDRLIEPFELTETYLAGSGDDNPNIVSSYDENGTELFPDPSFGWAAGGIVSTPRDLARWGTMFFGGDVLSQASMTQMLTPVELPDDMDYAHGVFVEDDGTQAIYGHTGGIGGFLTYMYHYRNTGVTVVVVSNQLEVNLRELSGYPWLVMVDL